ncbi:hypothetical protein CAV20_07305 [Taylorella equigenitalis]|nr:hypothetical protein CAV20_07305 [Taylorella equigenitalis]
MNFVNMNQRKVVCESSFNRVVRRALLELSTLEWREVIFSLCSNAPSSSPPEPQSNPNPKSHLSDDSTD